MPMLLLIWLGLVAFSTASWTGANCTFPNGNAAAQYQPCYPNNDRSHCCGQGDGCVANGFCQSTRDQMLYRGGCAGGWDESSTACPRACYRVIREGPAEVWRCSDSSPPSFWCGTGKGVVCADTVVGVSLKFTVGNTDFNIISVVSGGAPSASTPAELTSSSAPTSSPSASSETTSTTTTDTSDAVGASTASTHSDTTSSIEASSVASTLSTLFTLISSVLPSTSAAPKAEYKEAARSNQAVYGVSIGVPLAALAIGLGIWAIWERGRRRLALLQHNDTNVKEPTRGWYTSHDRLQQKPELDTFRTEHADAELPHHIAMSVFSTSTETMGDGLVSPELPRHELQGDRPI